MFFFWRGFCYTHFETSIKNAFFCDIIKCVVEELLVFSRVRKVSTAQVLFDINITQIPHGLRYKIADSGQVIVTHVTEGSEADENGK